MNELINFNAQALACCDVENPTQKEFDIIIALLIDSDNTSEASLVLKNELDKRLSTRFLKWGEDIKKKLVKGEKLSKLNTFIEQLIPYCFRYLRSDEGYRTPMHITYMALCLCLPKIESSIIDGIDYRLTKEDVRHKYLLMIFEKLGRYKGDLGLFNYLYYDVKHRASELKLFDNNVKPKEHTKFERVKEAMHALQDAQYPVTAVEVTNWINANYYKDTKTFLSETQVESIINEILNQKDTSLYIASNAKVTGLVDDARAQAILHMFDGLSEEAQRIGRILIEENYLDNKEKKTINIQDKQYASVVISLQKRVAQSHLLEPELLSAMKKHRGGPGKMLYQVAEDELRLERRNLRGTNNEVQQ